jgi:hypothetical protein
MIAEQLGWNRLRNCEELAIVLLTLTRDDAAKAERWLANASFCTRERLQSGMGIYFQNNGLNAIEQAETIAKASLVRCDFPSKVRITQLNSPSKLCLSKSTYLAKSPNCDDAIANGWLRQMRKCGEAERK